MPFYKLVRGAEARADAVLDELILAKNDSGEVTSSLSTSEARKLEDDLLEDAKQIASRLGYSVEHAEEPEDNSPRQPVGDDVVGMSPPNVGNSGGQPGSGPSDGVTPIDQQGTPTPAPGTTPSTSQGGPSTGASASQNS